MNALARCLQNHPPLSVFLGALVLMMGGLILLQMLAQRELDFIGSLSLGLGADYHAFHNAARILLAGGDPYSHPGFVTPPGSVIASIPLAYFLPFSEARFFNSLLSFAAVVASLFLMHRLFQPAPSQHGRRGDLAMLLIFMIIPLYSHPFHFLFDRGNADGFTLLLMCIGVYLLAKGTVARDLAAGFFLACAISFKIYPALVALPLIALGRWRPLAALAGAMAFFILLSPSLWLDWVALFTQNRGAMFNFTQNSSLAGTLFHVGGFFNAAEPLKNAAVYVWGAMLLAMAALDFLAKPHAPASGNTALAALLLYVPFMVAVPQLAYQYELVCVLVLLPVVCHLWTDAARPGRASNGAKEKRLLMLITLGLILTQFHAYAAERLLVDALGVTRCSAAPRSLACLPQWLPGFGLFLMMAGSLAYKVMAFIPAGSGRTWGFPTFPRLG